MSTASCAFQIPEFARRYRVLAYDMRAQGRSDHPEGEYSLAQHADDLAARRWLRGVRSHISIAGPAPSAAVARRASQ